MNDEEMIKAALKPFNKSLKKLFSGHIHISFMLEIMYAMIKLYPDLIRLIGARDDLDAVISGEYQTPFYVICEHIVGVHRSKTTFLSDKERVDLENDKEYRSELMDDVYKEIQLRRYTNFFLRKTQILRGDKFLLFPVPYYLTVIETRFLLLCSKSKTLSSVYTAIANKSFAVLSLLQDNLMDCGYPTCRVIIENYLRMVFFKVDPDLLNEYLLFAGFELKQGIGNKQFDEAFFKKYKNRVNQQQRNIIDYLHYGWVDAIPDYHIVVEKNPYSFGGLKSFVSSAMKTKEQKNFWNALTHYHTLCSAYTHGSIGASKYPLAHYFEVCSMLVMTTLNAYVYLCDELGEDPKIDGIDVVGEITKHFKTLKEAEKKMNTESLKHYYKSFKIS